MPGPETAPFVVTVDFPDGKLEHPADDERAVCRAIRNLAALTTHRTDGTWWVRPTGRSTS